MQRKELKIDWFYMFLGIIIIASGSLCKEYLESRFLTMLNILCYIIMGSGMFLVIVSFLPERKDKKHQD